MSQFTLAADTTGGNRPGFSAAAPPELGRQLFDAVLANAKARHAPVAAGVFGGDSAEGVNMSGCWMTCHMDLRTMPDASAKAKNHTRAKALGWNDGATVERFAREEGAVGLPHPSIPLPTALYGDARVNSAGLDLSSEDTLRSLAQAQVASANETWGAEPLSAAAFASDDARGEHGCMDCDAAGRSWRRLLGDPGALEQRRQRHRQRDPWRRIA